PLLARWPQGAQSVLMINLPGILQAARPKLTRLMRDNHATVAPEDITQLFGAGIVGTERCDGNVVTLTGFVPVDYERLIRLFRAASDEPGRVFAKLSTVE